MILLKIISLSFSTDSLDFLIESAILLNVSFFFEISKISQYSQEIFDKFDSKSNSYCFFVKLSNASQLELEKTFE